MGAFLNINHFFLKLTLAPLIITLATLVARRWGERIGGLVVGLPLTSAPVSVFFALEQGRVFAANAAKGAMEGLIAVSVFCTAYVLVSRHFSWLITVITSIGLYLITVWLASLITLDLAWTAGLVAIFLIIALGLVGPVNVRTTPVHPPWWDIPVRMLVAASLLILITTLAGTLGPNWSGLLSPFPIFTFVMVTFSHSQAGPESAWRVIRGVLAGLFSYTAFFLLVSLLVIRLDLWLVYLLATITALSVNGLFLWVLLKRTKQTEVAGLTDQVPKPHRS